MTTNRDVYNAAVDLVDGNLERGRADRTAFVDPSRSLSFGELAAATRRMVGLLRAAGVRREERVAMLMQDTVDFPVVFWGCLRAGVVPVALNTLLGAEQYAYILDDCRAHALFIQAPLLEGLREVLDRRPHLQEVFVVGGDAGPYHDFGRRLSGAEALDGPPDTERDEPGFWLYSSGSTGSPKGVLHRQGSLRDTADTYGREVLGIEAEDVVFSAAKL
ncbi:MAG: AMP-binding protein, partial [Myxococcota bacterium]